MDGTDEVPTQVLVLNYQLRATPVMVNKSGRRQPYQTRGRLSDQFLIKTGVVRQIVHLRDNNPESGPVVKHNFNICLCLELDCL